MCAMVGPVREKARTRTLLPVLLFTAMLTIGAAAGAAAPVSLNASLPLSAGPDGGLAWSNANSPAGGLGWGIGGSAELLVVSTIGDGTLASTDNGATWEPIPGFPITESGAIVADPTNPARVYVGGFGGLARTEDAGETWEHIRADSRTTVAAVSPTGLLAVSARDGGFGDAQILVSADHGATWTNVNAPFTSTSLYGVAFGPSDDHIVAASISRTWVTTDGGASWSEETRGALDLIHDADGVVWRAGMGPFDKSSDGGVTWSEVQAVGFPRSLAARDGGGVFTATEDGILFTADGGASWTNMGFGEVSWAATGMVADPHVADGVLISNEGLGVLWVGPAGAGAYKLEGRTNGFPPVDLMSLGASGDGSLLLAGGQLGLFASRDGGESWSHTGAGYGYQGVRATTASHDGSIVYAGGQNMFFWPFLLYSQNGGITWDWVNVNIGGDGRVVALVAHPDEQETAYAVIWGELTTSEVWRTTDGGNTWDTILVSDIRLNTGTWDAGSGTLLVGTDAGALAYVEALDAWVPALLTGSPVTALGASGTNAYAGGPGSTLFRSLMPTPLLLPWASTGAATTAVAAHPSDDAVFAVTQSNQLQVCQGPIAAATCAEDSPPGGLLRDTLVASDGSQVFVATIGEGLWRAALHG